MFRAVVGACAVALGGMCWAVDVRVDGPSVYVNEVRIHTFATASSGQSPDARAMAAANVLREFKDGDVFVKKQAGKSWVVSLGAKTVVTCTSAESKALKVAPQTLAAAILDRLVEAVKLPPFTTDLESIDTPPDKPAAFHLIGSSARKAVLEASAPGIVRVTRSPGLVKVTPVKEGSTVLRFRFNADSIEIPVTVRPYAYKPVAMLKAEVIGDPADRAVVAGAVSAAIQTQSGTPVSNQVWVKVLDATPLMPGQMKSFRARVKANGPGCYPYEGEVVVKAFNVAADAPRETELWYSNEPENIERPGRLYWGELKADTTARLLFHHVNSFAYPLVVRYMVVNPSDTPATVAIALGDSRPDRNPTRAGYVAGDQFMSKWVSRSAEIVHVPARSIVPVSLRLLSRGETCSGLASLSLRKGGPDKVVVIGDSVMGQALYDDWKSGEGVSGAWHAVQAKSMDSVRLSLDGEVAGVFPEPFRESRLDYEVGGRFGFTRIGDQPITNSSANTSLQGNFGVIYDIQGILKNPTPSPVEVELLFEASAGYGSGLFVLNGEFVRIGLIEPKREIVLASIKLPPGVSKPLSILTLPLSGANYPVTLIVRPTGIESSINFKR